MFRPLPGHHQAFLRIKSVNAAYMLGFQLCLLWDHNMYVAFTELKRPDDGPVRAETCSLIYNKYDVLDVYIFKIILVLLLTHRDDLNQIPLQAYTGQEVENPRISRQSEYTGGKVVSPTLRSPLFPQQIPLVLISVTC